ncbi:acyltransferase [Microbacterium sp. NPDC077644]|uniref:acyltransferase family protein n=1 Tax=Microbacterium sp. NPDC077644 TaxID=3155055 RepID=UPI00344B1362
MRSLDGVRGAAAAVVLVYHCSLIAMPHLDDAVAAWLTQTPAKILFAGTEAVLVFFVLSGFVVALPVLRDGFSWLRYYPTRILRLYLPVWASVVLATGLIALVPRDPATMPDDSWMQNTQAATVTWSSFFDEALLTTTSYDINNVLWSLRWELIFSLGLPVFIGVAIVVRRHALIAAIGCCPLTVAGRMIDAEPLVYLPVFLLGTLMAVRFDDLLAWVRRPRHPAFWPTFTGGALALLMASWLTRPVAAPDSLLGRTMWGLAGIGAVLVIVATLGWPRLRTALEGRVPQWLGRTSYSLYLVHVPVIATLAYLWGNDRWPLVMIVGIPTSLVLAAVFHRVVEAPSQRIARMAGGAVPRRARSRI